MKTPFLAAACTSSSPSEAVTRRPSRVKSTTFATALILCCPHGREAVRDGAYVGARRRRRAGLARLAPDPPPLRHRGVRHERVHGRRRQRRRRGAHRGELPPPGGVLRCGGGRRPHRRRGGARRPPGG